MCRQSPDNVRLERRPREFLTERSGSALSSWVDASGREVDHSKQRPSLAQPTDSVLHIPVAIEASNGRKIGRPESRGATGVEREIRVRLVLPAVPQARIS